MSWTTLKEKTRNLNLELINDKVVVSNESFMQALDVLEKFIPNEKIVVNEIVNDFDHINSWTRQIEDIKTRQSLAAVAVLTSIARAVDTVSKLNGSKYLLESISKHNNRGLLDQLMITYFLTKYVKVLAVEQEKGRVDILATTDNKKLNIHVKGTNPYTKDRYQIEAFSFLQRVLHDKPILNSKGEPLSLVLFDGYVPKGIDAGYWEELRDKISLDPKLHYELKLESNQEPASSNIVLEFNWGINQRGEIKGIDAFHNAPNRIAEVNNNIPMDSNSIEIVILVNNFAKEFVILDSIWSNLRVDCIFSICALPSSTGSHFERSQIFVKPEYTELKNALERALPLDAWFC